MKRIFSAALLAVFLQPSALRAVEVSLEENRAERGNIGFVDMQKLFKLFPETQKAKQNFEDVLRQAEEQVNLRKAELIGLRAEISRLKMEKELVEKITPPAPKKTEKKKEEPKPEPQAASTTTVAGSTATAAAEGPQMLQLPGMSAETSTPVTQPRIHSTLEEFEHKIAEKQKTLETKEKEFKTYQAQVEKNLLELESRRTEILLGKIYGVVQDVARQEGVSVVVDKSQILFGHKAVDLTDKVVAKLKTL